MNRSRKYFGVRRPGRPSLIIMPLNRLEGLDLAWNSGEKHWPVQGGNRHGGDEFARRQDALAARLDAED